jgi:hypothetical protein
MTEANDKYTVLQDKLVEQRDSGNTLLTEYEEDKLLEEMDPLWYEMTDDERGFHNISASEWAKNREEENKMNKFIVGECTRVARLAGWSEEINTPPWCFLEDFVEKVLKNGCKKISESLERSRKEYQKDMERQERKFQEDLEGAEK